MGIEARAPSRANAPAFRDWWATCLRMGASPGAALTLTQMNAEIDIRHVLPAIRVPTLVLHRTDDLPFVGDQDAMLDAIEAFLNRTYHDHDSDRVLATVLSAQVDTAAGQPGHDAAFDAHVRREIEWFRGRALHSGDTASTAAVDGPARAIRCAASIAASAPRFGRAVRVGLHTGECAVDGAGLRGLAVDVARALGTQAAPGDVLVSRTVKDLVAGSGLSFVDRGIERLGDDPQRWRVFAAHVQDPRRP